MLPVVHFSGVTSVPTPRNTCIGQGHDAGSTLSVDVWTVKDRTGNTEVWKGVRCSSLNSGVRNSGEQNWVGATMQVSFTRTKLNYCLFVPFGFLATSQVEFVPMCRRTVQLPSSE